MDSHAQNNVANASNCDVYATQWPVLLPSGYSQADTSGGTGLSIGQSRPQIHEGKTAQSHRQTATLTAVQTARGTASQGQRELQTC